MIVWGGTSGVLENTGAQFDPTVGATGTWSATNTTGAPSPRYNHTAVWTGTKMIVWGGLSGTGFENTGGQYDPAGNTWVPTSTTGAPSGRRYHSAVWTGTKMVVWGGFNPAAAPEGTGAQYDPVADAWLSTTMSGAPSPRYYHTAVWTGTKMIIWGGWNGSFINTGARWNPLSYYVKN
jgi:hypothetical protein